MAPGNLGTMDERYSVCASFRCTVSWKRAQLMRGLKSSDAAGLCMQRESG